MRIGSEKDPQICKSNNAKKGDILWHNKSNEDDAKENSFNVIIVQFGISIRSLESDVKELLHWKMALYHAEV